MSCHWYASAIGAGIKDQDRNIRVNQELLLAFFASAKSFLTSREYGDTVNGEIHVSLKSGEPYDSWQVRKLARTHSLECTRSMAFRTECYPGYTHRRTLGFKEGVSASGNEEIMDKNPRMLIFARKNFDHTNIKKSATKGAKTRRSEVQQHPDHSDDDDSD
jgi:25S rRNA (uracil2634-N3)-methyltransferase